MSADARPHEIRAGALPREPRCHACPHAHHLQPCDWCDCPSDYAPGID